MAKVNNCFTNGGRNEANSEEVDETTLASKEGVPSCLLEVLKMHFREVDEEGLASGDFRVDSPVVDFDDGFESGVDVGHFNKSHRLVIREKLNSQHRGGGSGGSFVVESLDGNLRLGEWRRKANADEPFL